ncbi:acyl-CoA dehydrogenase family protein [Cupriavidus basilensis]|uniref:acyl-CoA dehydrogenase family protein n=1 Tax=Cupriavidus basilensis TaxID=68895 RepID=UPI0023E8DDE7|nr:acyl-CoA dehydrogenase family protein [Cupriavidus basilensis]MDF3887229.1 acyl-CoA dehydrogenase family protein [Cupriavidus basilensis]
MSTKRRIFEPEHDQFRDAVARFIRKEVAPHVDAWRKSGCCDRTVFEKAGEQGLLLMWAAEQYGGAGMADFRYEQILYEEMIRHGDIGVFFTLHSRLVAPYIARLGNDEQKARLLPDAASGKRILAIAMTEPGTGSDLAGIQARARKADGGWLLQGTKTYISNGLNADAVIVVARTDPAQPRAFGLFLVERGMPGFERGRKLDKLGLDAQDTAELLFDNVFVPDANLLGDPAKGLGYLAEGLAEERLLSACQSVAHAQVALDLTLDYVKARRAFGRPLGAFQNTRFALARKHAELDAMQSWIDTLVIEHNAGRLDAPTAASAKLLTSELENRLIDDCLQFHGGAGYMDEYRISRMYRDARVSRIYAGSSEIMLEIVGRSLGLSERMA